MTSRRNFLKLLGGGALALPTLEYFLDTTAHAAVSPTRYVVIQAGISSGCGTSGNQLRLGHPLGQPLATAPVALKPLTTRGVRADCTLVSNLEIPRSSGSAQAAPAAGLARAWHDASLGVILSGFHTEGVGLGARDARTRASTSDVFVADAFESSPIHYRVQATNQTGNLGTYGTMSWRRKPDGSMVYNDPVGHARTAFDRLVSGYVPPDGDVEAIKRTQAQRKTAVDRALGKRALLDKLGTSDRQRLTQHFDELQALEAKLAMAPTAPAACTIPTAPSDNLGDTGSYAHEKERGPIMVDLIKTAFACDLTRVATLLLSNTHSHLLLDPLIGVGGAYDVHESSHHSGDTPIHQAALAWHVDLFARLVAGLKATTDAYGNNLLANTAVVLVFEGGAGADPEGGTAISPHSAKDMNMLCAGLAVGKAATRGINLDGQQAHPSSVLLTAMRNVGVSQSALNEVSTTIPALAR